ncbi:ABC transporter ATP-binding protein [Rhizobium rhizogenes]|uniref:ABC transporter ATP-binding protein n=1 Tax=Rhizobium rhizogenes TaxID=359 RepID=UPI0004D4E7D8|nr:ABC transporter ATP-binding protein [Rhizobium rhizogenes]KEA08712.1 ABC transporter ATPase [Rhizobium rhizogenes]NTI84730.1 ABC transporter ATP-binding protein [Rhizobium rhizogenes]NTJ26806.1 ABC transporter ATP-binding protein [Rhizobium rhizogenes]QUE84392.1 ABC transporter ATP-binding protein [Rhizobium rhizogenes]TQO78975.1 ABC transporter ATP-binding protein [Rhizobium rhizogenes]
MEKSLARYIWSNTRLEQIWILTIVAASMIPYFLSFDLPKQIVNGPIQGKGFEHPGDTQTFMHIAFDLPLIGHVEVFEGLHLTRFWMLIALSLVFLALVVLNGLFKLYINTYKGRLGERMLRRIRFELIDRVLRFPPAHFKRVKPAEIATMIKDEVEPMGGFTGDAFVQPALLGGQALTALIFIIMQNFWLGMIAAAIVAVQAIVIPRMRKRLLELGRQRQLTARELSGRVGEIVEGIGTIHANDTSNLERADIAARLGLIFSIRYDLYQWKFMVKFINNFLAQVTPFLFYSIGGFLALQGRLDIGQLVAVINAYKDLPGPLKELIDWDQSRQDVQVKYNQVVEQFSVDGLIDPKIQLVSPAPAGRITHPLVATNITVVDDSGARVLDHVSVEINPGETVAIVGESGAGGEYLAEALGRLVRPDTGRTTIDGRDLLELPESLTGRRIAYASSDTFFFHGTLRSNLLYGLKHAPLTAVAYDEKSANKLKWQMIEARRAGNPELDLNSDWVDYAAAGATGPNDIYAVIRPVLDVVAMSQDILDMALRSNVDTEAHEDLTSRIVELRQALRLRLKEENLEGLVVPFEFDDYNPQATVGENLLFGTLKRPQMTNRKLAAHPYFQQLFTQTGLNTDLYDMGLEIAENAVELFTDLPPDHPFFQQLTFMTPEDIPTYEALLQKLNGKGFSAASPDERAAIIRLSFSYIEPRHRFGLLTQTLMEKIVTTRIKFYEHIPADLAEVIERYDPERFTASATLMDNVLFGRIAHQQANAPERIHTIMYDVFERLGMQDSVLSIGLDFDVGSGGKRLTNVQRQKLNLGRALLKRADYIICNRPLPALDHRIQDQILRAILTELDRSADKPALIWVLSNPNFAELFDRVLVFNHGSLVESGTTTDLLEKNGMFKELLS